MAGLTNLQGVVCLLTGASGGIGEVLAQRLGEAGAVVGLMARQEAPLRALQARVPRAQVLPVDLTDTAAAISEIQAFEDKVGPIELLINNAGIETFQHFHTADPAGIQHAIALNLTAPIQLCRHLLPQLLRQDRGHNVNIASTAGLTGTPYGAIYSATKAGLLGFTASIRLEYADTNVSASAICPGFVHGGGMHEVQKREVGPSPRALGGTTLEAVAQAVLRAIRTDAPEIIVNSMPLRGALAMGRLFPRLGEHTTQALVGGYMKQLADHRAQQKS